MYKVSKSIAGYSLIELSVVLVVVAILVTGSTNFIMMQMEKSAVKKTQMKLDKIQEAIWAYYNKNGHLPCAAARNGALSSASFGVETDCSAGAVSGTVDITDIRIGVVPTRALNLSDSYMHDGWNNRFTYAVVKDMAQTNVLFSSYSTLASDSIRINDANGNRINPQNTVAEPNLVAYILASHGDDGKGGYNIYGNLNSACGSDVDSDNCDDDINFVDSYYNPNASSLYDDMVRWETRHQIMSGNGFTTGSNTGGGGSGGFGKYGLFVHEENSGVEAGTCTSGIWNIRTLNTEKANTLTSATLASNKVTLAPGTYIIKASAPAARVDDHKIRLYNVTDSSVITYGTMHYSQDDGYYGQTRSELFTHVTLSVSTEIRLEHACEDTSATFGLGMAYDTFDGNPNIFAILEIWEQ